MSCCNTSITNQPIQESTGGGSQMLDTLYVNNIFAKDTTPTALINSVNPATTAALINQSVRTDASPTFNALDINTDIVITTPIGQGINLNCTNVGVTNNELAFGKNGVYGGSVGLNLVNNDVYLWSANDVKFGSNSTERVRILKTGIATDNTAANVLALQGTTLVSKNNLVDTSTAQTLTNKTLTAPNLVGADIRSTVGGTPINFSSVGLTGAQRIYSFPNNDGFVLLASGSGQTVAQNLNFLTNPSIAAIVNGGVLTLPTGTDTLVGQATTDTLTNKTINTGLNTLLISAAANANINTLLNQPLLTTSTPTFSELVLTNLAYIGRANATVNTAPTPIPAPGAFVAVNTANLTTTFSNLFSSSGITGVQYTGSATMKFLATFSISLNANGNVNLAARLNRNGATIFGGTATGHAHNGNLGNGAISSSMIVQLSTNDIVDIQITNATNTTAVTAAWVSIVLVELPVA